MQNSECATQCRWFNPDSGAGGYGFGTWPGNLARNAYDTSKVEPYTGRLPGRDWLRDQQLVKMKILAEKYQTHVMVSPSPITHLT